MNEIAQTPKSMTFEEALHDPAYALAWDVIRYVGSASDEQLAPRKFKMAHKDSISDTLKKLHKKAPRTPLRKVIAISLKYVPDDTSAKTVLELTEWAVSEWEKLATQNNQPKLQTLERTA